MKDLVSIGKLVKTHGLKGHLKVFISPGYEADFSSLETIFVNGLPYFIREKNRQPGGFFIVLLEDIDNRETAQALNGRELAAPAELLRALNTISGHNNWIGFTVQDKKAGELGIVNDIVEMPGQLLLKVIREQQEILIPVNDSLVTAVHKKKKKIETALPDGFLDIF